MFFCDADFFWQIDLTLYDPKDSITAQNVSCDKPFCLEVNGGPFQVCRANESCSFAEFYGDGSSSTGYFMEDIVHYDQVSGDLQTTTANGSISFGWDGDQFSGNCMYEVGRNPISNMLQIWQLTSLCQFWFKWNRNVYSDWIQIYNIE